MSMRRIVSILTLLYSLPSLNASSEDAEEWIPLFDGKTLNGWRVSENPDSIQVKDGLIACDGPRAHAFYTGPVRNARFKNFEFKAEVMARPVANSGVYFHTEYQQTGYPDKGYEVQINNTYVGHGNYREYKKTGSLYGVRNLYKSIARDNAWTNVHIVAKGRRVLVWIDGQLLVDYTEPDPPIRDQRNAGRVLSQGTFALQCHDPAGKVFFRNVMVRPLSADLPNVAGDLPIAADKYGEIVRLHARNFPLIDLHAHLKGGLTIDDVREKSRQTGINYGIALNCGLGFPTTNDAGIDAFLKQMEGQPVFLGMQAEGREWVNLFSREAIAKFDYVFTDSMTFTDDTGKRVRLWIKNEVNVRDKQAFMDMLVEKTVGILENEPIDIYVNPTYLPAVIAAEYDTLWTPARMQRVIDAAVRNDVAIEINSRFRLPSPAFIRMAKKAGVKFSFGTNNGGRNDLGTLDYSRRMIEECGLTAKDLFLPKCAVPGGEGL